MLRRSLERSGPGHGQTIPGIGPQTAATLLGELGALTRFTDARALVAYVGFYPVIHESGDRAATPRLSRVGPRLARHALYLAAVNAVRRSGEWRTIYLRKKAQGKTAKQALVVVAVKLLHALYAMLKHRQPYNPSRLLVAPTTMGLDISWDVSVGMAGGSLAERRDAHQHRAARTGHPDVIVVDRRVELAAWRKASRSASRVTRRA